MKTLEADVTKALACTLQAILDNPTDERLRLEYADLLDQAGDHDRAEFIRVQCSLEKRGTDAGERAKSKDRAGLLLKQHEKEWSRPVKESSTSFESWVYPSFRRGFVEYIDLDANDFLTHAQEIFARAPIQMLVLSKAKNRVRDISQCPFLSKVAVLCIESRRCPFEPPEIAVLSQSPYLGKLSGLGLGGNLIMDEGAAALAASPQFKNLKRLFLDEGMIGDQGVQHLSTSPHLTSLQVLNLQGNFIGDEGAKALIASSNLRSLQELYLDTWTLALDMDRPRNPISPEWRQALCGHFGPTVCSFSPQPLFKASLLG